MKKFLIFLAAASSLLPAAEEVFAPAKNGGWLNAASGRDGVFVCGKGRVLSALEFKVEPDAVYRLSGQFRSDGSEPRNKLLFFGAEACTADGKVIGSPQVNIFPGTETVLARDLAKKDAAICVKDASKWNTQTRAGVVAFGAKDGLADLPNAVHSPNIVKIEKQGDVWSITLKNPSWNAFPAGTPVRQHAHGPGRNFFVCQYRKIAPGQWRRFSGKISGIAPHGAPLNKWWRGTAGARVCIQATAGVEFKDVVLEKENGKVELLPPRKKAAPPAPRKNGKKDDAPPCPVFAKYYAMIPAAPPRPRLFFNAQAFEAMKKQLAGDELLRAGFERLLGKIDAYPAEITGKAYEKHFYGRDKFGPTAFRAAFAWKLTGKDKYRELALALLKKAAAWYNERYAAMEPVDWTSFTRIEAFAAYDWLFDTMSRADRREIGQDLLRHAVAAQDRMKIIKSGLQNKGEGTSPWNNSFYGTPLMKFYIGLALRGAGVDDAKAEALLKEGLNDNLNMLAFREKMAGGVGGAHNSTPGYAFGDAPVPEWFFYLTFRALTGHEIAMDHPGNGLLPHWLFYATFPGPDGLLLEHGTGGAWHTDNKLKMNIRYLGLYRNFFGSHPAAVLLDSFIASQPDFKSDDYVMKSGSWPFSGYPPWLPFQYRYTKASEYKRNQALFDRMPKAFFFSNLGQTYMFSGRGKDDTYAMFTCGAKSPSHKQPDENHFVIYKGGFLALDSGTRTASGHKDWLDDCWHDNNYYSASIAHNVVTIRMEGEKFSGWPHPKYAVANHGGMYRTTGGIVRAFETDDLHTYVCGDSTACYRKEKCRKMIRQFVYIRPDYFVVCDTLETVRPDQKQTWLLHSQNEPSESEDVFSFDEDRGRLFCRTFLPEGFTRVKIGGPGREFWSDGKNYPLGKTRTGEYARRYKGKKPPLFGNWRVELSPGRPAAQVRFLNLIQVGLKDDTPRMVDSRFVSEGDFEGVRFTAKDGAVWTVLFDKTGLKGKIRAQKDGRTLLDRALTDKIQKQKAFQK
ncbi:MAG: heparinase II/III family protein [Lentisphaeria bacterium]|nr:heparinase II/III family protein [Lentisphaeria bacterium]